MRTRRLLASLASLAVAAILAKLVLREHGLTPAAHVMFGSLVAVPVVAAGLVWTRRLGPQLLARGAWWSLLLAGGLVAGLAALHDGAYLALGSAVALLAAGRSGLGDPGGRFAPVAFRTTLLVALILAIADTGAFAWIGTGNAMFEHHYAMLAVVPLMIAGVIGLMRLRTWGLIVSVMTNALIIALAANGVFDIGGASWLFVGTAVLQLLVPLPMVVTILRGRAPDPDAWRRTRAVLPVVMIVAVVGVSFVAAFR